MSVHLTIIELTMWLADWQSGRLAVWQTTPRTSDVTVTKIAGCVLVRILVNRLFVFVFLAFILFTLRPLC